MWRLIKFTPRVWFLLGFLGCMTLLAMGAYFQFVQGLDPCPLCISQRLAILATGMVFLIAALHNPKQKGITWYAVSGAVTALSGAAISIRHVWLQHLPPEDVPECGPGLDYVLQNLPLAETIKLMLSGTGDCAKVDWTLFGFSMPAWTLAAFLMLATLSLLQILNRETNQS
ncbi:Disulfide bond formation protein B [Candidatus Methylobacter favarea]|uniref:Disulfide bond formation protein B n=1 Tax=Candidatus Methylobacter favarea TaxID=2707345 RepID=A0A8S0XJ46_9GAMM|nr:disulfide bond formation protein B [Candidatus Methylobacter favarea]CAA9892903.1 Disulfide bond formation protein B [Candidatus Methylobacter favarea]